MFWNHNVSTGRAICAVKTEHWGLKPYKKHMKKISDPTDHLCELVSSLFIRIQMGDMSRLGRVIGFVKHSLYFYICCSFQFSIFWLHPSLPYDPPPRHVGTILNFLEVHHWDCAYVHGAAGENSACFVKVASTTFTGNTIYALSLLLVSLSGLVFMSKLVSTC
jgi:hypothetical protein